MPTRRWSRLETGCPRSCTGGTQAFPPRAIALGMDDGGRRTQRGPWFQATRPVVAPDDGRGHRRGRAPSAGRRRASCWTEYAVAGDDARRRPGPPPPSPMTAVAVAPDSARPCPRQRGPSRRTTTGVLRDRARRHGRRLGLSRGTRSAVRPTAVAVIASDAGRRGGQSPSSFSGASV